MSYTQEITGEHAQTRILVVDDEPRIRKLLGDFLSGEFKVNVTSSANEARALLEKSEFDIALVDMNMPEMNGREFFGVCRKQYRKMQFMLMTGKPEFSDAIDIVKGGAFYYLLKPLDLILLHSLILKAAHEKKKGEGAEGLETGIIKNLELKYRIVRSLGSGSSGVVLLVEKEKTLYAMKLLRNWDETVRKDSEKMQRFIREAETLSKIDNEHIVKICDHSLNKPEDSPYIIMEYVKGSSLTQCLNDKVFDIGQKISIILQIADALECVHAYGVLHRDIKPENILVTEDMMVKITDFGTCHIADSCLTMADEILGSPSYMAPESFDASTKMDVRSDIFSLGVISYEMLTGSRPFEGENLLQIMESVRNKKPVAPIKINPEIPVWLQDVMAKMLDKNPNERYNSAGEIIKAINRNLCDGREKALSITSRILRSMLSGNTVWS
jgi:DNA-binding response OmpR family regulator